MENFTYAKVEAMLKEIIVLLKKKTLLTIKMYTNTYYRDITNSIECGGGVGVEGIGEWLHICSRSIMEV